MLTLTQFVLQYSCKENSKKRWGYEDFIVLKEKEGFRELISILKEMDSEKIEKLVEMAKII